MRTRESLEKTKLWESLRKIKACLMWFSNAFVNSIYYFPTIFEEHIVVNAWVIIKRGKLIHHNWGDDINVEFIESLTGKKVIVRNQSLLHRILPIKNYCLIGSVVGNYENSSAYMWGTGIISPERNAKKAPKKICSVRGKNTRNILLNQGLDCPENYGDPVLLASKIYQPSVEKRYKIGVVPNHVDIDNDALKAFLKDKSDVILVDLTKYEKWTDIIDQMVSCEIIVSSSLHGLIVSDSYGIPNVWVSFSDHIRGGNFKYLDYFSSVYRDEQKPIMINNKEDLEIIFNNFEAYLCNAVIDFSSIVKSCPFPTKLDKVYAKSFRHYSCL